MKYFLRLLPIIFFGLLSNCTIPEKDENYTTKTAVEEGYSYEYVTGDPTNTRIYTLENGLKVYLSVYKDEPRVQVFMPVKAGGKNDPADNTGLAHYLEHMVFKGTDQIGTLDYEKERPLLDSIESLFNSYAKLTSDEERKAHYRLIDQTSNEAAKYAIPNEYDKLIAGIGGKGSNAYTTNDATVYITDVPSNQMEKFLAIEANRFGKIVNRLFHTELEAVYEEKNRSLDSDGSKAYQALTELAFEKHQYGTQTVIGTIEHLKNPSITQIEKYFDKYYRPNNMAICISGDIDPTATVKLIEKYFGNLKPNPALGGYEKIEEEPISTPRKTEVFGPDAETVYVGFRFPGESHPDQVMIQLVDFMINNSEAGLMDLNLMQKQKLLTAGSFLDVKNDYSIHTFVGRPKEGQKLEEVQQLLLEQIELIKKGEFEDWLIDAVVNDFKKTEMNGLESNYNRGDKMVTAFSNGIPWATYISRIDRMEKITREEVIEFVNKNYVDNHITVFKRTGEDPNKQQIEKPVITKIPLNRDEQSAFHQSILAKEAPVLKPVFVDFEKDIVRGKTTNGVNILSKENSENELFSLTFLLDIGSNNDPTMNIAAQYLEFLGTSKYSAEELKKEFYKLGCSMRVSAARDKTYVTLNGLNENMEPALTLFEELLVDAQADEEALKSLIDRMLKARADSKKNKGAILFNGLLNYAQYGENSPFTNVLSNTELLRLEPMPLIDRIKRITQMEHRILYYGPRKVEELQDVLNTYHKTKDKLDPLPDLKEYEQLATDEPKVYWTNYDMVQTEFVMYHRGDEYNKETEPAIQLFNEYFGGAVVFQEIREAQGLAYSVFSSYATPSKANRNNSLIAYVGTQADKQAESMEAMLSLLNNMPESEANFEIAKKAILTKIESERVTKADVLWNYEDAKNMNLEYDIRKDVYQRVKGMTLKDLKQFQEHKVKNKSYVTVLVGNKENIDFEDLEKYGKVQELTLDEIFGYGKVENIDLELE